MTERKDNLWPKKGIRVCLSCRQPFEIIRHTQVYCSMRKCQLQRKRNHRAGIRPIYINRG